MSMIIERGACRGMPGVTGFRPAFFPNPENVLHGAHDPKTGQ